MNFSSITCSRFAVIVNEGDEIYQLRRNKLFGFLTLCQCPHVLEKKSGSGENFSREHNFLLESENPAMKIFKLFSIPEVQDGLSSPDLSIHVPLTLEERMAMSNMI